MKKVIIGISALFAASLIAVFCLRSSEDKKYKAEGAALIEKIEAYKKNYGELPESVSDLNLSPEMDEGPYYEKVDSLNYTVYFNVGFDNALTYYSGSKHWKENP